MEVNETQQYLFSFTDFQNAFTHLISLNPYTFKGTLSSVVQQNFVFHLPVQYGGRHTHIDWALEMGNMTEELSLKIYNQ